MGGQQVPGRARGVVYREFAALQPYMSTARPAWHTLISAAFIMVRREQYERLERHLRADGRLRLTCAEVARSIAGTPQGWLGRLSRPALFVISYGYVPEGSAGAFRTSGKDDGEGCADKQPRRRS